MHWQDVFLIAELVFVLILCFWGFGTVIALLRTGVPFVKTFKRVRKKILEDLHLKPAQKVVELGCGDASFLLDCEQQFPEGNYVGYELSWWAVARARLNIWRRRSKVRVVRGNFFKADLSDADLVYCYLMPEVMERLKPKFAAELKPGALVYSLAFSIKDREPIKTIVNNSGGQKNVFVYQY